MKGVILDLNFQVRTSSVVVNKAENKDKSAGRDFSSILNGVQTKDAKTNEDKKEIKNSKVSNKREANVEEVEKQEEVIEPKNNLNHPAMFENLIGIIDNTLNVEENFNTNEFELNDEIESISNEVNNSELSIKLYEQFLMVENIEINVEETDDAKNEEIVEQAMDSIDLDVEGNAAIKTNECKANDVVKNTVNDLGKIKHTMTVESNETENDTAIDYLFDDFNNTSLENNGIQDVGLNKVSNSEENQAKDNEFNSMGENSDNSFEVDVQSILTVKNEVFAENDTTVKFEEAEIINKNELINQIVEKIKFDFQSAKNEIKIKLKPEILGEMTMKIEVEKGMVTAKIIVDNQKTKEIIEGNLFQLKEEIKDTGLEIKTFEVFVSNSGDFNKHNSSHFNFSRNSRRIMNRGTSSKATLSYDENQSEANKGLNFYGENSLDLLA